MKKTDTMLSLHYTSDPIKVDADIRTNLLIIQARKYVDWIENVQWMATFLGLRYRLRSKFNKSRLQAKFKFHI